MTETELEAAEKKRKRNKTIFAVSIGAVFGFLGAMVGLEMADSGMLGEFDPSREIALLVGLVYILTAVAVLFGLASPKAGATFLNVEDAEELREQKSMLGYSGIGMAAAGIALIVVALGGENGAIEPLPALAIYAVLTVVSVAVSLLSRKHQDELMRAIGQECAALAFYLVVFIGGTWALFDHLGLTRGPAALDWLTMFWGLLLLSAFIVTGKRGMLEMR